MTLLKHVTCSTGNQQVKHCINMQGKLVTMCFKNLVKNRICCVNNVWLRLGPTPFQDWFKPRCCQNNISCFKVINWSSSQWNFPYQLARFKIHFLGFFRDPSAAGSRRFLGLVSVSGSFSQAFSFLVFLPFAFLSLFGGCLEWPSSFFSYFLKLLIPALGKQTDPSWFRIMIELRWWPELRFSSAGSRTPGPVGYGSGNTWFLWSQIGVCVRWCIQNIGSWIDTFMRKFPTHRWPRSWQRLHHSQTSTVKCLFQYLANLLVWHAAIKGLFKSTSIFKT